AQYRIPALRETLKAFEYLALFALVALADRADPDERPLRLALAGSLGVVALVALAQAIAGAPSVTLLLGHPIARIAGPLEGPNQLAGYLGIALPLVLALALARGALPLEIAALALGAAALLLTLSRAGIVSTLIGLSLVALLCGRTRRSPATFALLAGLVAGAFANGLRAVLATGDLRALLALALYAGSASDPAQTGAVGHRGELWHAALVLWRRSPLLGIGAGNYERELGSVGLHGIRTHANSLYLQALAEGGIVLLVATLATVIAPIVAFARGPLREPLILGALGASVVLALHQTVDLLVFYPKVGELWWIALALGAARADALRSPAPSRAATS
ncbi:MAG: O-antigen ligase family protein, partial [Vulcanimicrobiaceae bacterium]